jgi:hypothetical protein
VTRTGRPSHFISSNRCLSPERWRPRAGSVHRGPDSSESAAQAAAQIGVRRAQADARAGSSAHGHRRWLDRRAALATALQSVGCAVEVYERTPYRMTTRGAGIVVQPSLTALLSQVGASSFPTTRCTHRNYLSPNRGSRHKPHAAAFHLVGSNLQDAARRLPGCADGWRSAAGGAVCRRPALTTLAKSLGAERCMRADLV